MRSVLVRVDGIEANFTTIDHATSFVVYSVVGEKFTRHRSGCFVDLELEPKRAS
jgi:hypothetical protein